MLIRTLSRALWKSCRIDKRGLASDPIKPLQKTSSIDSTQAEYLDKDICLLVDEKDNFIGTATKGDCHKVRADGSLLLHRAFSVYLFNSRGDILLQRRASGKVTYPSHYSNACCSHPLYIDNKPEDIIVAARRKLNHELGVPYEQTDPNLFTYLTRMHYQDNGDGVYGEHEIDYILFLQADVDINHNLNEISECHFVPKSEFDAFIPTLKGPFTPWFNMIRRDKLKHWWDNLHRLNAIAEPDKIHKF